MTHVRGQTITSIADIQWALDPLPVDGGKLEIRSSLRGTSTLTLAMDWKKSDASWRGSLWNFPPRLRVWAPELTVDQRRKRGLPVDRSAYLVRWINTNQKGGRATLEAGLRQGDVIIALDGESVSMVPQRFHLEIMLKYRIGDELPITVLRGGERKVLRIRLVE